MPDSTNFKSESKFKKSVGYVNFYGDFNQLIDHIKARFSALGFEVSFAKEDQIVLKRGFNLTHAFRTTGAIKLDFFKYNDRTAINYTTYNIGGLSVFVFLLTFIYILFFGVILFRNLEINQIVVGTIPLIIGIGTVCYQRISNERHLYKIMANNLLPDDR